MERRAKIVPISERVTCINDAGMSTCFLVKGDERALLIDTLNGLENLYEIVRELTELPLTVVNTHGHLDHIYGNIFFDEAYMSPKDFKTAEEHFAIPEFTNIMFKDAAGNMRKTPYKPCPLVPLEVGHVFDLGGATLETVDLRGHTPGSLGLLYREEKMLFSGDGVNGHTWMQLDESLPISELAGMLTELKEKHGAEIDMVLHGHRESPMGAELIDGMLAACGQILKGDTDEDTDYKWFGGVCKAHKFGEHEDGQPMLIIYRPETLRQE